MCHGAFQDSQLDWVKLEAWLGLNEEDKRRNRSSRNLDNPINDQVQYATAKKAPLLVVLQGGRKERGQLKFPSLFLLQTKTGMEKANVSVVRTAK